MPVVCQFTHEVCDDEFGYWNSAWGDPPVHEFSCDKPANFTVTVKEEGPNGVQVVEYYACWEHVSVMSESTPVWYEVTGVTFHAA